MTVSEWFEDSIEQPENRARALLGHVSDSQTQITTGFFRYQGFFEKLADYTAQHFKKSDLRILFAPCSIGCEPYSFAAVAQDKGLFDQFDHVQIDALDSSAQCTAIGENGLYPSTFFEALNKEELRLLLSGTDQDPKDMDYMLNLDLMDRVNFLPAQDLQTYRPAQPYDVVVVLNLLCHLPKPLLMTQAVLAMCTGVVALNWGESTARRAAVEKAFREDGRAYTSIDYKAKTRLVDTPRLYRFNP